MWEEAAREELRADVCVCVTFITPLPTLIPSGRAFRKNGEG